MTEPHISQDCWGHSECLPSQPTALNSLLGPQNISREKDPIVTIGYVLTSFATSLAVLSNQRLR
jgi:hypothetical protein